MKPACRVILLAAFWLAAQTFHAIPAVSPDLTAFSSSSPATPSATQLPPLSASIGVWGDFDNDGDADLLLGGSSTPQLIRNEGGGLFTNTAFSFIIGSSVASAWGNYDGNGGLDFFSSDCFPCAPPRLYENDGNGVLSGSLYFSINMWVGTAVWGDVDNSGRACALVAGWVPIMEGVWGHAIRAYTYLGNGWQEAFTLGGRTDGSVNWVDFDADGDLDVFYTGQQLTAFWTNHVALQRDFPQPPVNPTVTFTALDEVVFSWQAPSNTPPTGRGLSYNLRVGRTPARVDVVSPLANPISGRRLVHALGNAGTAKRWKLIDLRPGTYFWSVQSIAQNYTGSPFAAEGMFTVTSSPPVMVTQPVNQVVYAGSNATFVASAIGTKPLSHQWRKNGLALTNDAHVLGSTSPLLTISNVQPGWAGLYYLVITNMFGAVTSSVATLEVRGEPRILQPPATRYVILTRDTSFTVESAGAIPLFYQWFFGETPLSNGERLSGVTSPTLSIRNVQSADVGEYRVVVSNAWGSVTSSVAALNLSAIRYVNVNNLIPVPPYTNWATAATVIQDAINAAGIGDEILVTNGVYQSGSVSVNKPNYAGHRIALNKPLSVISVNGPQVTTILARSFPFPGVGRRGAYLTNGALLAGFTLTAGKVDLGNTSGENQRGAGILCESLSSIVSNCVIVGNIAGRYGGGVWSGTLIDCVIANNSARDLGGARMGDGGGAYGSTLVRCILSDNYARYGGGGVIAGTLTNCLVTRNSAVWGAGAYVSTLANCTVVTNSGFDDGGLGGGGGGGIAHGSLVNSIVVQNTAPYGTPNFYQGSMSYCCTWPAHDGVGNITADPAFVDAAGGNYRLQTNSPCLNAGTNGPVTWSGDLDSRPRVVDGVVDMGAYEFQHLPWVAVGPASQTVPVTSNALFTVTIVGDEPLTIQWQKDGVPLSEDGRIKGVSSRALEISGVTAQDAGGYRVIIGNALGFATSAVAALTVVFPPAIVSDPASLIVAVGATTNFTVLASGTEPLTYQWRKEGTNLAGGGAFSGVTTPSLQIANANTNHLGHYDVVVSNPYGMITSAVATLDLFPLAITHQPLGQSLPAGTNVTFTIGASGTSAISYQWRFNQTDLSGQTNTSLMLSNIQAWNGGEYDVVVANIDSNFTSAVAVLTVLPASPTVVAQPASQVASVGQTVAFIIKAAGSEPMLCQWQRNATDVPGATAFTLNLSNVNSSFNGTYRARVENSSGIVFSTNASLVVSPILIWGRTNEPQLVANAQIPASATNILAIAAGPTTDLGLPCMALRDDGSIVAWGYPFHHSTPPSNAVDVAAISVGGSGSANNLVLRADGTVVHWSANTSLPPSAVPPNSNFVAVAAGGAHQLALRDDGTVVAWGNNTFGQTNVPPYATNVVAIAAGTSHSLALRADGTVIGWGLNSSGQATALGKVANAVAIAAGADQSLALLNDGSAVGSIVTNDSGRVSYGAVPADATNLISVSAGRAHTLAVRADRTVTGWGQTNNGQLNIPLYATNALAVTAGGRLSLALVPDPFAPPIPPRIARPPLGRAVMGGQSLVFNALAVGGLPLRYQWYRGDTPLPGQSRPWLALTNVLPNQAGDYRLVAMNDFGSVTSSVAVVTVRIPEPQLSALDLVGNQFRFSFQSLPGVLYIIESRNSLSGGSWMEFERRFGTGGPEFVTDTAAGATGRFYRIKVE